MRLSPKQIKYLSLATDRPLSRPGHIAIWWEKLWIDEMIDVVGNSVYITEKGREALEQQEGGG